MSHPGRVDIGLDALMALLDGAEYELHQVPPHGDLRGIHISPTFLCPFGEVGEVKHAMITQRPNYLLVCVSWEVFEILGGITQDKE